MIKEAKKYLCDRIPTDEDIYDAIAIATLKNCVVELNWHVLNKGWRVIVISRSSTLVECIHKIQAVYGERMEEE